MAADPPRVSVALTAFNAEPFLAETIESVLSQDFPHFEFLLLNDGSTDRTGEVAEGYASIDARIRVISRGNRGMPASLNELFAVSRAPLVARLDADDVCHPNRLSS
jgi:glycosyltransferase involved in cell wall biosynthesis